MSIEQLEAAIRSLPAPERRRLVTWLDDHRHELIGTEGVGDIESSQRDEVLLRLAETDSEPGSLQPLEEADLDVIVQELTDARAQKPSSGPS